MPLHIAGDVEPVVAWTTYVSHRKAPGAMSAIAFIVRPVRPNVACILGASFSAILVLLMFFLNFQCWDRQETRNLFAATAEAYPICGFGTAAASDGAWLAITIS